MPATVQTRGVLKASQNRVRTSVALQGSSMWEDVIGIVNEERGTNAGVEALINAPKYKGGRESKQARKAAAAEAVMATGAFDTALTDYESLLSLAKSQGAVGSSNRGACKICGELGHLTKQCRNQFSKFFQGAAGGNVQPAPGGGPQLGGEENEDDSEISSLDFSETKRDANESTSSSEDEKRYRKKRSRSSRHKDYSKHRERKHSSRRRKERSRDEKRRDRRRHRSRSRSRDGRRERRRNRSRSRSD